MLLDYPCAMQRRNIYRWRKEDILRYAVVLAIVLQIHVDVVTTAPASYDSALPKSSEISEYFSEISGCYYNFQRYEEGDRIVTNEPCLNCTCHNRMLMCYLRVCPFTKAIGQDCTIEKKPDQCCPIITCPEVPVKLLTSSTTSSPTPTTPTTEIGFHDNYGCTIHNSFYADGAQVPSDPRKPCELCYCIRNRTACVMQECTLHVEGCKPVYQDGVCCPVRYDCDYEKELTSTSHTQANDGNAVKSTTYTSVVDCQFGNQSYADGESITTDKPCEHCYCMRGDIVCAVQDCGEPLRGKDCVPMMPPPELCCPSSYDCTNDTSSTESITRAPKPFSTDHPSVSSTLESSSLHSRLPAVLSQEQIYEKLGEHTSSPTHSSTTVTLSQEIGTVHPSENIEFDKHTVDVSEYSSTVVNDREESTAPSETEKVSTTIKEMQPVEYGTEKASSYTPSSFSAIPETTIVSDEVTTEPPITYSSSKITKLPSSVENGEDVLSADPSSHGEETTTSVHAYESTNSPAETTKFEANKISDKVIETTVYDNPTTEIIDEENRYTTIYSQAESKPPSEQQSGSNEVYFSSEANRYTFTTREFDRSTTAVKEDEIVTKFVEDVAPTETSVQDSSQQPNEEVTDYINTISERTTQQTTIREKSTGSVNFFEKGASITTTEETVTAQSGIPGEGSCLVDGITYPNTSIIDSSNPCHQKCVCISSIPTCSLVTCQAPPSDPKCMPVQIKPESCCPVYICSSNENEQVQPAQIPSQNQFAPQPEHDQNVPEPEHDQQEEHEGSESGNADEQTTEEAPSASSVNTSDKVTVLEKQPAKDDKTTYLPYSPTLSSFSHEKDTTVETSDVTESVEHSTFASVTEPSTGFHPQNPTVADENSIVSEEEYQKVTQFEISSRLPPIVVTELPESLSDTPISSNDNKESLGTRSPISPAMHTTNQFTLSTVTEKNVEVEETTITLVDSNDLPNYSQDNSEQDKVPSTVPSMKPTKIVEVVTEEVTTEKVQESEPDVWNGNENKTQNEINNYALHTTYPPPSDSPESFEPINTITTITSSSSNSDSSSTNEFSSSSPTYEEVLSTLEPGTVDSQSTKKVTEINTTGKPDDNEVLSTIHSEHEPTPSTNEVYNSPEYLSTIGSGEPNKETSDEPLITSTTVSETTILPYKETTNPPLKLATHDTASMDVVNENMSEPLVTSSPAEMSEISTVTESSYTKEGQHIPSTTTVLSSISYTEYEEIRTTFPPSSLAAENTPESPTTAAPVFNDIHTTKEPETNEIASEEGFTEASLSHITSLPDNENVTEKQASTSSSEATPVYTTIQHSTWTPKPLDSISSSSSSSSSDTTSAASFEENFHPQSSVNSTSGTGDMGGSDNTSVEEYDEEPNAFGPGTCRYNGKQYTSAQQIPRDDPCDFCFCFRSDIICLQQSCPPPIHGCRQEPIQGFCCPRYECPVGRDMSSNASLLMTTAEATSPITTSTYASRTARIPHHSYREGARKNGCFINGYFYNVGDDISIASGPCLECKCGSDGRMKCDPKACSPEPHVKQIMAESSYRKR